MDRQPTLVGEAVTLRPLRAQDWADLYAVAQDPELWAIHPNHDRWKEANFRAYFDDALAKGGALAVIENASGQIIGSSRFQSYDPANGGSVEIGWTFLARSHWGGATNFAMKRLMLRHALRLVERVDFRVGEDNAISRRAMEKIGGRLSNRSTMEDTASGRMRHVVYEIDRAGFASGPLAER